MNVLWTMVESENRFSLWTVDQTKDFLCDQRVRNKAELARKVTDIFDELGAVPFQSVEFSSHLALMTYQGLPGPWKIFQLIQNQQ